MSVLFRNDQQRAAVCQALCEKAGLQSLWTPAGPSERATQLLRQYGGTLSTGEHLMFLTAWAVWNGDGEVLLADLIERLDSSNLETLGTLLVAFAQDGIDEWVQEQGRQTS